MANSRKHIVIEFEGPPGQRKVPFGTVALLPSPEDNCAIASTRIEKGTILQYLQIEFPLNNTILEGHRFALNDISEGQNLFSWGMPFGKAITKITQGDYVVNESCLESLEGRKGLNIDFPINFNFSDVYYPIEKLNENFKALKPLEHYPDTVFWNGYQREDKRGVGTRNYIVLIGLTGRVRSFVKFLENSIKEKINLKKFKNIDGIISVSHTEGGDEDAINNLPLLLRTMAGFLVHPNIGAVLAVDSKPSSHETSLNLLNFKKYLIENNFPIKNLIHEFFEITGNFENDIESCSEVVLDWLPLVNQFERTQCPLNEITIALQCGGSDAFSGISGNPVSGLVAKEVIKNGGSAILAETDELIGAEDWIVKGSKNENVANHFLSTVKRFKDWAHWHGHSPEGNPSGGNKLRGLYNITLKSLGAAMKKPVDVPLDGILEYGERIGEKKGYYFMDSPGNDLESIAGQVSSGCQLIFFITGNGSITNFPFVPTIKIVTTSKRFELLNQDMDFNAGKYLDGVSMEQLTKELFDLTLQVISGDLTVGEKAKHSQVSLWRNWTFSNENDKEKERLQGISTQISEPSLSIHTMASNYQIPKRAINSKKIGLVLPTSICSSPIASIIAEKLNEIKKSDSEKFKNFNRFVALPHTEGCGSSGGPEEVQRISVMILTRTMLNHLVSPLIKYAVCIEHGCEKTHNDLMANLLENTLNVDIQQFGWASVQLDGGIQKVSTKIIELFEQNDIESIDDITTQLVKIALLTPCNRKISNNLAIKIANLTSKIVSSGGLIIIPQNSSLISHPLFLGTALDLASTSSPSPTLGYGKIPTETNGLHFMQTFGDNWVETMSGLGATGISIAIVFVESQYAHQQFPSHPLLPLLKVIYCEDIQTYSINLKGNFDLVIEGIDSEDVIWNSVLSVLEGNYVPKFGENVDFQLSRGYLGISL